MSSCFSTERVEGARSAPLTNSSKPVTTLDRSAELKTGRRKIKRWWRKWIGPHRDRSSRKRKGNEGRSGEESERGVSFSRRMLHTTSRQALHPLEVTERALGGV